jgi:hypothetical protein
VSDPNALASQDFRAEMREEMRNLRHDVKNVQQVLVNWVRVEEKQISDRTRLDNLEARVQSHAQKIDTNTVKLNTWIQRGVGLYIGLTLAGGAFAFYMRYFAR